MCDTLEDDEMVNIAMGETEAQPESRRNHETIFKSILLTLSGERKLLFVVSTWWDKEKYLCQKQVTYQMPGRPIYPSKETLRVTAIEVTK